MCIRKILFRTSENICLGLSDIVLLDWIYFSSCLKEVCSSLRSSTFSFSYQFIFQKLLKGRACVYLSNSLKKRFRSFLFIIAYIKVLSTIYTRTFLSLPQIGSHVYLSITKKKRLSKQIREHILTLINKWQIRELTNTWLNLQKNQYKVYV